MKNEEKHASHKVRSVREDELDEFLRLMCRAFHLDFGNARPIFFGDPFYDLSLKRVLIDETTHRMVSGLTIVPAAMRLPGGATVSVAGIAGVSTQPEMQRQGCGRALLEATLADLPKLGFPLAALTAEAPGLYRRVGFETCSTPIFWQATKSHLPTYAEGRETRILTYDQWTREAKPIRMLYDRALGSSPGCFQRDARRWSNIESPGSRRSMAVWKNQGRLEAYLIFQEKPDDNGVTLSVLEMVSESEAGCRALIGFLAHRRGLAAHQGQSRGSDIRRFGLNTIAGVESRVEPGMLVRVTDFEAVLAVAADNERWRRLLTDSPTGLTIRIEETHLSWSQKSLRLFAVKDQSGNIQSALAPADELIGNWISLENHALSQLVTGFKSVRQLHSEEHLRASGEDAMALAEQLFPRSEPYLGLLDVF